MSSAVSVRLLAFYGRPQLFLAGAVGGGGPGLQVLPEGEGHLEGFGLGQQGGQAVQLAGGFAGAGVGQGSGAGGAVDAQAGG